MAAMAIHVLCGGAGMPVVRIRSSTLLLYTARQSKTKHSHESGLNFVKSFFLDVL